MLREVGSAGAREDFVAETWTSAANFAVAYLRHMHGTNRYYTALMGDSPSGVSDGGKVGHSAVLKITLNVYMEVNESHSHYFVCDESNCLASAMLPALGIYQALSASCFLFLFECIQELVVLVCLPAFLFLLGYMILNTKVWDAKFSPLSDSVTFLQI